MVELGIWSKEYALGEKLFVAMRYGYGYGDASVESDLRAVKEYESDMKEYTRQAEIFLSMLSKSPAAVAAESNGIPAVFRPIERTKENFDRIHMITLATALGTNASGSEPDCVWDD